MNFNGLVCVEMILMRSKTSSILQIIYKRNWIYLICFGHQGKTVNKYQILSRVYLAALCAIRNRGSG